ncbi:DUF423 domain-containing protein [Agarivorans sp. TSD2052]|uniref:DUF423 domain-containing protein n=1 Tax=Agarivorans sp. TSD2052 TaxID=2937286 RepID=UPI00200F11EB|nr:DUF423 domain-containing protein [Agarivorans sp. TSD2052]UPW17174.1 DUF423 domain-containing protein [Agarivorans sp. TSD2052]
MNSIRSFNWPMRLFVGLTGAFVVVMGAGAAHGFSRFLGEAQLAWIETGVTYQLIHLVAALAIFNQHRLSAILWLVGSWMFAGSLYGLAFWGATFLGPVTPLGGVVMILGWLCLVLPSKNSCSR